MKHYNQLKREQKNDLVVTRSSYHLCSLYQGLPVLLFFALFYILYCTPFVISDDIDIDDVLMFSGIEMKKRFIHSFIQSDSCIHSFKYLGEGCVEVI